MQSNSRTYGAYGTDESNSALAEFDGSAGFANPLIVLRKYKWQIILCVFSITSISAYYAKISTPIYRASSTILIEPQKANVVSIEEFVGVDSEHEDYYLTQFQILKSRKLAERVIDELQLWDHPELSTRALKLNSLYGDNEVVKDTRPMRVRLNEAVRDFSFPKFYTQTKNTLTELIAAFSGSADESTQQAIDLANQDATEAVITEDEVLSEIEKKYSSISDEQNQRVVLNRFINRLIVTPVRKTKLVRISYESAYPDIAQKASNALGEQYIGSFRDAKQETTARTSVWLSSRLKTLKTTLDNSEQKLIRYKEANGLIDVNGSVGRLNEQKLLLLTAELAKARSELSDKSDILKSIRSANNNSALLQNIPSVQANGLVQRIQIEKGAVLRNLGELQTRYGELHPKIVDERSQLATLEQSLNKQVSQISRTIEKERQLLSQRVAAIEANLDSGKLEIQLLGTKKIELESLEREVATNQKIYDTYFNRMTEANSADGLETANAKVVDFAQLPVTPIRPQKQMIVALSALTSLLVSTLLALLYDKLDRSVKSTRDVEHKLGSRMLGVLPVVDSGFLSRKTTSPVHPEYAKEHGKGFLEALNTTKTTLCIQDKYHYQQVILVTSSVPGEGKSTISTNLASAFGKLDKVLLIDCDLRRPAIAKCAGIDRNTPGLSNLISGTATADSCLHESLFPNVDVIPSGPIPDEPLEFLTSPRFKSILKELCGYYDRIILDCAPTQAVSDALILSTLSDSVIYVVKSQSTSIDMAKGGLARLREVGAPLAGVVLSRVDANKISSYAGDYYFQGYYDFYGYDDQSRKEKSGSRKIKLTPEVSNTMTSGENADLDMSGMFGGKKYANRNLGFTQRSLREEGQASSRNGTYQKHEAPDSHAHQFDRTEARVRNPESNQQQRQSSSVAAVLAEKRMDDHENMVEFDVELE